MKHFHKTLLLSLLSVGFLASCGVSGTISTASSASASTASSSQSTAATSQTSTQTSGQTSTVASSASASAAYKYTSEESVKAAAYPGLPSTEVIFNTTVSAGNEVAETAYAAKVVLSQDGTAVSGDASFASVAGNVVTLTNTGTSEAVIYLTGTLTEGYVTVAATSTGAIKIILDGVSIANSTSGCCPIYDAATSGGGLTVEVNEGSKNFLNDTRTAEKKPKAVIYTAADNLTLTGKGTLTIGAAITNGFNVTGQMTVTGDPTVEIQTYGNAVKVSGIFEATGKPDFEIKTTYQGHGITADGGISVSGEGIYNIVTIDGSTTDTDFTVGGGAGLKSDGDINISAGSFNITTAGGKPSYHYDPDDSVDDVNTKGIKAGDGDTSGTGGNINISGGTININSRDDALHASGYLDTSTYAWEDGGVNITGGTLFLATGDDAVHGDGSVSIDDAAADTYIDITSCYEGFEGVTIDYKGGTSYIVASDDAVNAASKDITNLTSTYYGYSLNISGGYLSVNSSGDGLDSNGDINITGGFTVVSGPSDQGNGELDYGDGSSCKMTQTGGTLIAYGSGGQMNNFSVSGTQYAAYLGSISLDANEYVSFVDASGTVVFAFEAMKNAASVYVSSPFFAKGTYNCYVSSEIAGGSEVFAGVYYLTDASSSALSYGTYTESATITWADSYFYNTGSTGGFTGGGGQPGGQPGGPGGR
jgi:hypothetical protein